MFKRLIPVQVKDAVKVLLGQARAVPVAEQAPDSLPRIRPRPELPRVCPVCRQTVDFRPIPFELVLQQLQHQCPYHLWDAETLNLTEYSCPVCISTDRDRLIALYFSRHWTGGTLLDIAPHAALTKMLCQLPGTMVRTADLLDPAADDRVDLTDMRLYTEGQFDGWICSHVLEHVPDDRRAMRELFRVLKPGGWGAVLVPLQRSVTATQEDPSLTDPAMRWKLFGQDDHVRLYARADFVSRLESAGFRIEQYRAETLGTEACVRAGVQPAGVLYIARKPG